MTLIAWITTHSLLNKDLLSSSWVQFLCNIAMVWMLCLFKIHMLKHNPQGNDTCWWLGHEGLTLMIGISAYVKETLQSSLAFPPCENSVRSPQSVAPDPNHAGVRILDLTSSQTVRNKFLLFCKPPTLWCCVIAA